MRTVFLILAALLWSAPLHAQDVVPGTESETTEVPPAAVPAAVTDIDTSVIAIRLIGPWKADDTSGFSRVVMTVTEDTPHLYVQWIERPADAEPNVHATVEIEDVAKERMLFGDMRVEAEENDGQVLLDTLPDRDGFRETYVLIVGPPSEVRFGPATN